MERTPEELPRATEAQVAELISKLVSVSQQLEKLAKDVDRLEGKKDVAN